LSEWQAKQEAGKNHKENAHGPETKALTNSCDQQHGSEKDRDAHVLVACFSRLCALIRYLSCPLLKVKELLVLGVVVLRHEDWPRRRLWIVERIGPHPSCEGRPILVADPPLEELRRLLLVIKLGSKPTIEGVAVVNAFLSCQRGKAFSSDSEPARLGVKLCALSSPLRRLVSTPRVATATSARISASIISIASKRDLKIGSLARAWFSFLIT
jgi:hypothetical protein